MAGCDSDSPSLAPVIVAMGFSAFVTQVVMMRELVSVLAGNELIYGVVLGTWLLLTGMGSWTGITAGRLRWGLHLFLAAQVFVAVLPVVSVFVLRTLRNVVFLRGAALGVTETVIVCLVCLAPYCLLIGYLLALASALVPGGEEARGISRVYFLDCVGGGIAGLLFSFVLVIWLDHFQILYIAAAVTLLCIVRVAWQWGRRLVAAAAIVMGCLGLALLLAVGSRPVYGSRPVLAADRRVPGPVALRQSGRDAAGRAIQLHRERCGLVHHA